MYLADTLSRASSPRANQEGQEELGIIKATNYLAMLEERIQEVRCHSNKNPILQLVNKAGLKTNLPSPQFL